MIKVPLVNALKEPTDHIQGTMKCEAFVLKPPETLQFHLERIVARELNSLVVYQDTQAGFSPD